VAFTVNFFFSLHGALKQVIKEQFSRPGKFSDRKSQAQTKSGLPKKSKPIIWTQCKTSDK